MPIESWLFRSFGATHRETGRPRDPLRGKRCGGAKGETQTRINTNPACQNLLRCFLQASKHPHFSEDPLAGSFLANVYGRRIGPAADSERR